MRYRLSVFAFFLLFIPLGSMGQEHWWKGDSVLYDKEILLSNPVLLSLGKIDKSVDAGFAYTRLKPVPEHWAGYPEEVSRWRFKAEGITRVGRFCGSGMAAFSRMHEKDLSFRLTNHSELFYPFIVADTVSASHHTETYKIAASGAWRMNSAWHLGGSSGYTGVIRHSRRDPRVLNNSSCIDLDLSAGYDTHARGIWTLSFGALFYKQSMDFNVYLPSSSEWYYVMRPFGQFNKRYSARESNGESFFHNRLEKYVRFVFLRPEYNTVVRLKSGYASGRLETRNAGVYLNERIDRYVAPYMVSDIFRLTDKTVIYLAGQGRFERRRGIERIYERVAVNKESSLYNYELLATNKSFDSVHDEMTAKLGIRYSAIRTITGVRFVYERRKYDMTEYEKTYFARFDKSVVGGEMDFKWKTFRLAGHNLLSAYFKTGGAGKRHLNMNSQTVVSERAYLRYEEGANRYWRFQNDLYFRLLPDSGEHFIRLSLIMGLKFWEGGGYSYDTSFSLSYMF